MRAESEVWRTLGRLTPTERRICTAFPTGTEVDLRSGDAPVDDPANADAWPETRTVRAEVLAALLLGAGRAVPGRVAALRLRGARVTGPLLLAHGRITASWLLEQCRIDEHIDLEGAQTGSIYLRGSHLRTLSAYNAHVDGVLAVSGATIAGSGTLALLADSVTIEGDLRARGAQVTGPVSLIGADIHGQVVLVDARIDNPGGKSLNAGGMQVGRSLSCTGMVAVGEVRLPGVQIGSSLTFNGASLDGSGGAALSATGLTVANDVLFRQEQPGAGRCFESHGVIWMPGARLGGNLYFSGARLDGRGTVALHARRATVDGSVNLDRGFSTSDEIRLTAARIGGLLDISGMTSPDALLTLYGASVAGGVRDVGDCWPRRVDLDGFTYGPFDPYQGARERLPLLRRQVRTSNAEPGGYRAQPYEQLAAYYRGLGNDGQARTVLLAKSRAARATQPWYRRIGGYLIDGLVGYGYRPSRAIGWALALLIGASVYYSTVTPTRVDSQNSSQFNPVLYTADQLIPVIRFGQPEVWQFHGAAAAVGAVLTVLGWTLGIAIAAAASRALTRT
ncbi:MAG TPA: hypothetical protein VFU65_10635 [Actinocrinis sp.]|nr:hypothetical protein [Actinocrinis sp.]